MEDEITEYLSKNESSRIAPIARAVEASFAEVKQILEQLEQKEAVTSDMEGRWEVIEGSVPDALDGCRMITDVRIERRGDHHAAYFSGAADLDGERVSLKNGDFEACTVATGDGDCVVLPGVPYEIFGGLTVDVEGDDFRQEWQLESAECVDEAWSRREFGAMDTEAPERTFEQIQWESALDEYQQEVVDAPADCKLVVDAPPGCGKTHTACARAVRVADQVGWDDGSHLVLFVSFTRIAVQEMRERIRGFAGGSADFQIWTIDQLAYQIGRHGGGTFEDGINAATAWLEGDGRAVVQDFRHVIVDEAQDIVGSRAGLVFQLLEAVSSSGGGFTIFHDPAQAIYDWAEDGDTENVEVERLVDRVKRSDLSEGVVELGMEELHRTDDERLASLFSQGRKLALDGKFPAMGRFMEEELEPIAIDEVPEALGGDVCSTFVLTRSRAEAMRWSSMLREEGIQHRLRFGGLPDTVPAWLAIVVNTVGKREITWSEFAAAWRSNAFPQHFREWSLENAWLVLDPYKTDGVLDCALVADAVSGDRPPASLSTRPPGRGHVTIGTIHGMKGREANRVIISISGRKNDKVHNPEEEARVWFVGLSRAQNELLSTHGWNYWSKATDSGRPWRNTLNGKKQVFFGLSGDLSSTKGLGVRKGEANSQGGIAALQFGASVKCRQEDGEYNLDVDGLPIGTYTSQVQSDLYRIRDTVHGTVYGLPDQVTHLYCVDVTTVSVGDMTAKNLNLKSPFAETRLWLQPIVVGLTVVYF